MQNAQFDAFQKIQPRTYQALPIKIIDIDEESLKRYGQWPWDRTLLAKLVSNLQTADVSSLAFDIIFPEPDRTSPKSIVQSWQLEKPLEKSLLNLPDHDEIFADALSKSPSVLGFSIVDSEQNNSSSPRKVANIFATGAESMPQLTSYGNSAHSLPLLESKAKGVGAISYISSEDGIIRNVPLLIQLEDTIYPALITETLRVAQKTKNLMVKADTQKKNAIQSIQIGKINIPSTQDAQLRLYYTPHQPSRFIPAYQILDGSYPMASLKNNIVIIGCSAKGLMDQRNTVLGEIIPGVEIHLQAIEQTLSGVFLQRTDEQLFWEIIIIVVGTMLVAILTLRTPITVSTSAVIILIASIFYTSWHLFSQRSLLLDASLPNITLLSTFLILSISKHIAVERNQKWIKEAFSKYVSPNLVSHLVNHPDSLKLGGEVRTCSFIFTDLAGFTSLIEKIKPEDAVSHLNLYLDQMIAIAFKYEGTLDRIVGDAVAIMFSAPVQQEDHAHRAYRCALEMLTFSQEYAEQLNQRGIAFGHTRIGVNTGDVVIGNFGGNTIFDYRALGDTVNTAARLESVNKQLGTKLCVSEATIKHCSDARVIPVGNLVLKGKSQAIKVYTPILNDQNYAPADEYQALYHLLEKNSPQASKKINSLSKKYPNDPLIAFYKKRISEGKAGTLIIFDTK
jgi:adenylate cyclase